MNEAIKKLRDAVDHVEQELHRISYLKGGDISVLKSDLAALLEAYEEGTDVNGPALARLCEAVGSTYIKHRWSHEPETTR